MLVILKFGGKRMSDLYIYVEGNDENCIKNVTVNAIPRIGEKVWIGLELYVVIDVIHTLERSMINIIVKK